MSDLPLPLPSGSAPAGVSPWLSHDALRWAGPRLPRWTQPRWSVLALLATLIVAIAQEPEPSCTVEVPCGPGWLDMIQMCLVFALLAWYARLPELAFVSAPVLAAIVVAEEFPGPDTATDAANVAVLVALAFGWAASWQRLALRSRQRHLAEQTAKGLRHPLPEGIGVLRRGSIPIVAGLLLCVVAGAAAGLALQGIGEDEQRAAQAETLSAVVLGRTEETLRVRMPNGSERTISAYYPEYYDTGSTVMFLADGDWTRPVAEPYDAFGWQLLILAAGLPGLTFLAIGVLSRRRAGALRRGPVPLLEVLIRLDHNGDTWIYAADDQAGRTPLFRCLAFPVLPVDPAADDEAGDSDPQHIEYEGDDEFTIDTGLREAVLYGAPREGGELLIVAALEEEHVVLLTAGPVRLPRDDQRPQLVPPEEDTADQPAPELVDRTAASMRPAGRPVRWGPSVFVRCGALLGVVFLAATSKFVLDDLKAGAAWWQLLKLIGPAVGLGWMALPLNWRVTADRSGLWLAGAFKVRHIAWEDLRAVAYTGEGVMAISPVDGKPWKPSLGWPWMERRLRLRPSYVIAVEEIAALHAHPELRPTEESPVADHGLPLGPVLALLYVLWVAGLIIL